MKTRRAAIASALQWTGDHTYACIWIVLAPAAAAYLALGTQGDWIAKTLFCLAGVTWAGVRLPPVVRHPAVQLAAATATLSGGYLTLLLGRVTGKVTHENADDLAILLLSMLASGTAAFMGQLKDQSDQRKAERALDLRLAELGDLQERHFAELRSDLKRMLDEHRCECRAWPAWRRLR